MGLGDPTTYVYQFIFDNYESNDKKIIQDFVMHKLGLCTKINSFVAHMLYAWSSGHNILVPISIK